MQYLSSIQNSQIAAGLCSPSDIPGATMQITLADSSTMNINGFVFTASTVRDPFCLELGIPTQLRCASELPPR